MKNAISLTYINDPGHGWLVASHDLVKELGIEPSSYSYMSHDKVYLEEDCDASLLLVALSDRGYAIDPGKNSYWDERNAKALPGKVVTTKNTYGDRSAKCRDYAPFNKALLGAFEVGKEFPIVYDRGSKGVAKILGETSRKGRVKNLFSLEVTNPNGSKFNCVIPKVKAPLYANNEAL